MFEKQSISDPDGCPQELAVLQRFWREQQNIKNNMLESIQKHKEESKKKDSDWWRGYNAAFYWIEKEIKNI